MYFRRSKQKPAGKLIPEQKSRLKLAAALWVTVAFVVLVAFGASAKNALLHESAVKAASDRFEQMMKNADEPESVKLAHAAAAEVPEPMPLKARAAKTPEEVRGVIRPLVSTNSSITYDPFDRIVKIVDPGPVTRQFVYSGKALSEERDGSGTVTKQFFDWGEIIGGTKYFYTRNHEGSITEMTDASGNIVAQYQYDAFGNPTRIAGSGPDSDFLYAGYFYHQPSGLYCTAHRIYNPKLGRWLNRDPIDDDTFAMMPKSPEPRNPSDGLMDAAFGQPINPVATAIAPLLYQTHDPMLRKRLVSMVPQTPGTRMPYTNLYEYAANNPVNFTDPSGLEIGMPRPKPKKPGGTCPAEGPSYEFCRKYCLKICEGSTDPECYLRCMIRCLGIGDDD